jgi:glycosyltransferase involved in cell wall biosynthesis
MDVSIIIPTYNRLWCLPKAVASCFETSLNVQVIVVDDGSTDGTSGWLKQQPNITVLEQPNMGKDWAVNAGFTVAKGKYVRFLDSDDWLIPYSTDQLFEEAEKNKLDVVCAGYQLVGENEKILKESAWIVCDDFIAQQLGECDSSHYSAYLFSKDFISDIPHRQEYGALDDRKFVIEVALKSPKTGYISSPTLVHSVHTKERLQNPSPWQESADYLARYKIYKKTFQLLADGGELTQRRKNAACNILWHLAHWVAKAHIDAGEDIYNWVYELNPQFVPTENLSLNRLFKTFGFARAEKLLRLRRSLKI